MNSTELKKQFPEIYQEFFWKCQRVTSSPHSLFWTGDFSGFYGGLTISSKLPLRFYVGLEEIDKNSFEINDEIQAYFPYKNSFKSIHLESHIIEKLTDLLSQNLRGYRMHMLTEVALGLSLGGLGAISVAIAALIKPDASRDKKFNVARTIALQIQSGRTSAATAYCSLSPSAYPTVFYQSGAKWWGKSLDELIKLPKKPIWPFDFGLIFSGNLVQGGAVIKSAEELKNISQSREKDISNLIGSSSTPFWDIYIKMLDQVSKQTLLDFVEVFKKGAKDDSLRKFFEGLNQYQNLLHFLEISTPKIDRIYSAIHRIANKDRNGVGSGVKISGVGKGGEVLFAVPFGQDREEIQELDESLDFASWRDGIEIEGVKIEQDLARGVISKFIQEAKGILKCFAKTGSSSQIYNGEKIVVDLLIDSISGKVFYKNKPVNSAQIPSQKATVEILTKLLTADNHTLENQDLGKYGKSRYDLQGKITTPLSKLTGLKFEISGGVYDDFSLKLKPFDLKIAVISSIA